VTWGGVGWLGCPQECMPGANYKGQIVVLVDGHRVVGLDCGVLISQATVGAQSAIR